MKKFFQIILFFLVPFVLTPSLAWAHKFGNCKAGCENTRAPGQGTGKSVCRVTFKAPPGWNALRVQLFDQNGIGLLHNKYGQIAIRGGEPGATRVSVDCRAFHQAYKLIACAKLDGQDKTRTIEGEDLDNMLPASHRRGGFEVQL